MSLGWSCVSSLKFWRACGNIFISSSYTMWIEFGGFNAMLAHCSFAIILNLASRLLDMKALWDPKVLLVI